MSSITKGTLFGLDIETECNVDGCTDKECGHALDFNRNRITLICVADDEGFSRVFKSVKEFINWYEQNPAFTFTAHNGKFDVKHLIGHGAPAYLLDSWVDDSSLLAFTYQDKIPESYLSGYEEKRRIENNTRSGMKHRKAGPHSLKTTAPYYLGVDPFWEPEHGHTDVEYVLKDTLYCLRLTKYFLDKLDERSIKFYRERYLPWTKNLLRAELKGIRMDMPELDRMWTFSNENEGRLLHEINLQWKDYFDLYKIEQIKDVQLKYDQKIAENPKRVDYYKQLCDKAIMKIPDFNIDSPKQLLWLFDKMGLEAVNLEGDVSTNKETLNRLSEEVPQIALLLDYRKTKKLNSTYYPEYKNYIVKNRIHCDFNVTEARTGRLSAKNPNLQNVPGDLHQLFIADEGKVFITRDLSAIEPTLLAYYSEDEALCKLMINNEDFHSTNAKYAFGLDCAAGEVKHLYASLRKVAKTVGLAVLYGAGANRVYQSFIQAGLKDMTIDDAKKFVHNIRELYSGVWKFKQELDRTLEQGNIVYNLLGRPYSIPIPQDVYMKGLNTLIQSSASDLLQQAAYDISLHKEAEVLLLIHDEVVVQVAANRASDLEQIIVNEMCKFSLQTAWGSIKIKTEGKISDVWEK